MTKLFENEFNEEKENFDYYEPFLCDPNSFIPEKLYKNEIPSKNDVLEMFHFYFQNVIEEELPNYIKQFKSGEIPLIEFLDNMVWLREEYISRLKTTEFITNL